MQQYVLFFNQINRSSLPLVGGKGANLGEMKQAGFPVPDGFCVTTLAYRKFIAASPSMEAFFTKLNTIDCADLNQVSAVGQSIREHLHQVAIPATITAEILHAWEKAGTENYYAVRSSATAEDLPHASFAGQQDTYLNIKGREELLQYVRKCWASLFTDRAIVYRDKNGFDHCEVYLSIVVQQMVSPDTSGIMFTADPVNGNRTVVSIDVSFGLGEALVSGQVSADLYKVKENTIVSKKIAKKKIAIYSLPEGGTITKDVPPDRQEQQALTDKQITALAALGRKIERHFGIPQDIEFCIENDELFIVQSRPITTLYPLPDIPARPLRILLSFGHVQMMTDAMKSLGLSVLQLIFPANILKIAGGRLFIDITDILHNRIARRNVTTVLLNIDEGMSRAVDNIVSRSEFLLDSRLADTSIFSSVIKIATRIVGKVWKIILGSDLDEAIAAVEAYTQERRTRIQQLLGEKHGAKRIIIIQQQLSTLLPDVINNVAPYVMSGIVSSSIVKKAMIRRFGCEAQLLNKLNKSLPNNVTSKMGLDLGDLADMLRELPQVQEYLKIANDKTFYSGLGDVPGGKTFRRAFAEFIDKYGMRCPGEIDITSSRWHETPTRLNSALFSHMQSLRPGEHRQRFAEGNKEAERSSHTILAAVEGNYFKTKIFKRLIAVYRHLGGLREQPKYILITEMWECKQAILKEAETLVQKGLLSEPSDVYFLELNELLAIFQNSFEGNVSELIDRRKKAYERYQNLKPPRVMTSEGEIVVVPPKQVNIPAGTIIGIPVSAGTAEGIARIILRPENAILRKGEILVAPHTDPGWTPLFASAVAVITEVGGLMTHGAVVAREYGIPAIVGVDDATTLIKDGEIIRVNGDLGYIEVVDKQ